jgi:NAD(P)-dependent dehydrogenase (short-subunit alcohol dehydrogenase family)
MIRVAVIDSGLNPDHPHIVSVAGGATVGLDGSVEEGAFLDRLGHGTAVTAAIQEKAPAAAYYAASAATHPVGRVGAPADIAHMVVFLADSSKSGFMTGAVVNVDGGRLLSMPTGGQLTGAAPAR